MLGPVADPRAIGPPGRRDLMWMRRRWQLVGGIVILLVLLGIGTLVVIEVDADRREREMVAAMRSDPVWQIRLPETTIVETNLVDECGPRTTVGYRQSTQDYESSLPRREIEMLFRERIESLGWRPTPMPTAWVKQIGGREYYLDLGLNLPGLTGLTMTSPEDMCQTNWL